MTYCSQWRYVYQLVAPALHPLGYSAPNQLETLGPCFNYYLIVLFRLWSTSLMNVSYIVIYSLLQNLSIVRFQADKGDMVPILPTLLQCISNTFLPGSARIEVMVMPQAIIWSTRSSQPLQATRGSNSLLEMCDMYYKSSLVKREDVKRLMWVCIQIINLLMNNFILQKQDG